MGYIPSAQTVYAVAYLTETGRNYLFNENNSRFDNLGDDLFEIRKFALSDSDTNYQSNQLLESGEVPDVTGSANLSCLKTAANYTQSNLLAFTFSDVPSNVSYGTSLPIGTPTNPPTLIILEQSIPNISPSESVPSTTPIGTPPTTPPLSSTQTGGLAGG